MFHGDIKKLAKQNKNFRKVIYTGKHSQIVVMSLLPNEDIGMETHSDVDQILIFVAGSGEAIVAGKSWKLKQGDVVFVPAGTEHDFKNIGSDDLKLYTIYSPPEHPDGTIHKTKEQAMKEKD
jgi:mannose-6-phosphate isomerase-like protein (cupin superfamily)